MLKVYFRSREAYWLTCIFLFWIAGSSFGQTSFAFQNLENFETPGRTWSIAGDVQADLEEPGFLTSTKGTGILVNIPTKKNKGEDLFTKESYGDMDLEVEFLVAKGSNSGIYLQGMYEIQILDSWGVVNPRSGDNGGIYERWNDAMPEGQKGFQGYAPRQNASKAPGLWQKLHVVFQAPRFDENGDKVQNAKMLSVTLNGVTLHENVELFGPTRGAMVEKEMARGPLRIQGDHGAVAFRNLTITPFDEKTPQLKSVAYEVFPGRFEALPDFTQLEPSITGTMELLSANVGAGVDQYLIKYTGEIEVFASGIYQMNLFAAGGGGMLRIGEEEVIPVSSGQSTGSIELIKGTHSIELYYAKVQDWIAPGIGLSLYGPGIRETQLADRTFATGTAADPILVDATEKQVLRSFMDLPGHGRVTHAVSVGSPQKVHYTYDLDHGNLVQVWRGDYLNATPMWNNRGDGSSRPMGAVTRFGAPSFHLIKATGQNTPDSNGADLIPKGYKIKSNDHHLTFMYEALGVTVADELEILADGQGIKRSVSLNQPRADFYFKLATASNISDKGEGLFQVGDKSYFILIENSDAAAPVIKSMAGEKALLVPARGSIVYTLLF